MYNYGMEIFKTLNYNPNLSLALGFFDGVHLGHKTVIESAVNYARKNGNKSAVITFAEHPCCILRGIQPEYILTKTEREKTIEALGIDYLYELDFMSISNLTADEYLKDVLVKYFSPKSISTGWNHCFGCKKSGNVEFLQENQKKYNYKYFELPPKMLDNEIISSTCIRNYLAKGEIEHVNKMLGRKFEISGEVIKGQQIGRTIGFRTANIKYPTELVELPHGVYAVETNFGKGIANYGCRPTVNGVGTLIEVHILNFNQDIYGKNLSIKFQKMLRPEKKFSSLEELKNQIAKDIQQIQYQN